MSDNNIMYSVNDINTNYDFSKLEDLLPKKLPRNRNRPAVFGIDDEVLKRRNADRSGNLLNPDGTRRNKRMISYGHLAESLCLGIVKEFSVKNCPWRESQFNKKFPELWKECQEAIKIFAPDFDSDCVMINHNTESRPHLDSRNIGDSIIVGLGGYEDGELVVDGEEYDIRHKPIKFNGSKLEHWNKKWNGDRWSIIWFKKSK